MTNSNSVSRDFSELARFGRMFELSDRQFAYVLATVEHETARTFKPVREGLNASDDWRKRNLRYFPWYGRGYVQLTWENNYRKMSALIKKHLGIDVLSRGRGSMDWALETDLAAFACIYGMKFGIFTGVGLNRYINTKHTDYVNARRIVNGVDQSKHIAKLALKWQGRIEKNLVVEWET